MNEKMLPSANHEAVLRMVNGLAHTWDVTDERLEAFASLPTGLPPHHQKTFEEMLDLAASGASTWPATVARYTALRAYALIARRPPQRDVKQVLQVVQLGALRDGVADREWVQLTITVLQGFLDADAV